MNRSVAALLRRLQMDPMFAHAFRRAPAQTLDRVRGLRAQDRSQLIDIARTGRLPRVSAYKVSPGFFQAYPLTYSVRRENNLVVCIGNAGGTDIQWKIVQVTGFSQGFQEPDG